MDNTKVFCEDCKHCKPEKGIDSWFGLNKFLKYHFAKCTVSLRSRAPEFVQKSKPIKNKSLWYCSTTNYIGTCVKFEPKTNSKPK